MNECDTASPRSRSLSFRELARERAQNQCQHCPCRALSLEPSKAGRHYHVVSKTQPPAALVGSRNLHKKKKNYIYRY